jgi:hypothetical protein
MLGRESERQRMSGIAQNTSSCGNKSAVRASSESKPNQKQPVFLRFAGIEASTVDGAGTSRLPAIESSLVCRD